MLDQQVLPSFYAIPKGRKAAKPYTAFGIIVN